MSRSSLGASTLTALESNTARPVLFVSIALDGGTERFHTWIGTITWGGNDWDGAGEMASFDEVKESSGLVADPVRMGLSGVNSTILSMVDSEDIFLREVNIYLGALDSDEALIEDPGTVFVGYAQNLDYTMGNDEGDTVMLTAESELIDFQRSRNVRYTDSQLQSEYSGDLGLEFLEQAKDARTVWRGNNNVRIASDAYSPPPFNPANIPFPF